MNTLNEIKAGQTGFGLLVENDGYISMNEGKNKELVEAYKLKESINDEFNCPYPFIVNAVFQKFGVKNANGRIYPEEVLKKEVEKYQQAIAERRAYGECYTPDAEVCICFDINHADENYENNNHKIDSNYCKFIPIEDVHVGDIVVSWRIQDEKELHYQTLDVVKRKIERYHEGKIITLKNDKIHDTVTPLHEYPLIRKNENNILSFEGFFTAQDIKDKNIKDFESLGIPSSDFHCDTLTNNQDGLIMLCDIETSEEYYKGKVYCIETDSHVWMVKQNGKIHWTKNCNHPDSTAIDVGRICLNIIELHWEGKTLVGQMEIPITEAFRRTGTITCLADQVAHFLLRGLKLGVSSRGIGNVEQKYGSTIVTDYELICWDLVSQPSTPGAWIGSDLEELKPYMESETKDKNKLLENLTRFDGWL